eukprot:3462467-Rhodomonas_salina.1
MAFCTAALLRQQLALLAKISSHPCDPEQRMVLYVCAMAYLPTRVCGTAMSYAADCAPASRYRDAV